MISPQKKVSLLHFVYFNNYLMSSECNFSYHKDVSLLKSASAVCPSKLRDELLPMKPLSRTNCSQLFSASSCSAPSSPSHLGGASARPGVSCPGSALIPSPAHNCQVGGLKQASGVGGTAYEISV